MCNIFHILSSKISPSPSFVFSGGTFAVCIQSMPGFEAMGFAKKKVFFQHTFSSTNARVKSRWFDFHSIPLLYYVFVPRISFVQSKHHYRAENQRNNYTGNEDYNPSCAFFVLCIVTITTLESECVASKEDTVGTHPFTAEHETKRNLSKGPSWPGGTLEHLNSLERIICLNMIVNSEVRVLPRLIRSVKDYIDIFVMVDTRSTDDTIVLIQTLMGVYGIQGEIHKRVWANFWHKSTAGTGPCHSDRPSGLWLASLYRCRRGTGRLWSQLEENATTWDKLLDRKNIIPAKSIQYHTWSTCSKTHGSGKELSTITCICGVAKGSVRPSNLSGLSITRGKAPRLMGLPPSKSS